MSETTTIERPKRKRSYKAIPPSDLPALQAERDQLISEITKRWPSVSVCWQDKPRLMAQLVACGATWREVAGIVGYSDANSAREVALNQKNWTELLGQARAERWRGIEGRIGSHMEKLALEAQEEREQVKAGAELLKHVSRMDGLSARSGMSGESGVSITIHVDASGGAQSGLPLIEVSRQDSPSGLLSAGQDSGA